MIKEIYIPLARFKRELNSILKHNNTVYIVTRGGISVAMFIPQELMEPFNNVLGIDY